MDAFKTYWKVYGGLNELLESWYLLLSLIFTGICIPLWANSTKGKFEWVDISFSIIPSMVSFSLGALAIILAFSNENFVKLLRQKGVEKSYFMTITTALFHFILIQFVALFFAIILLAYQNLIISGLAFGFLSYAVFCGIAASAVLLDMSEILNKTGILDE